MKIIVIGSFAKSLINFRGPLLKKMAENGHEVFACAPGASERIRDNLLAIGVKYSDVPLDRAGINPAREVCSNLAMFRLFRNIQPNVVLLYTIKPVLYGSIMARLAKVPYIFSIITGLGYAFSDGVHKRPAISVLTRFFYKMSLGVNFKIFFQNPDDVALFSRIGLLRKSEQAVLINGSGVDLEYFKVAPLPEKVSFLLMGRLIRDKGVIEYVEASRIIRRKYPEVVFRIVGWIDSNPAAVAENQLLSWIKEGIIEYMGKLEDVRPAIEASSVYVLPSYREGTPRSVLEAMAMGRPVITTDAPGCRETVVHGENGFLIPVRDVSALVRAMETLIRKPDLVIRMGHRSRELAEQKYNVDEVNKIILETMRL